MTTTPSFYDPRQAERWSHRPDTARIFADAEIWRRLHAIEPAASDTFRIALLLIDMQRDFTHPEGALYVGGRSKRGGIEDTQRVAEFVYRNLGRITEIVPTLDSHLPYQIFFSPFWRDSSGAHPAPFTVITADDIRKGRFEVDPATAQFAREFSGAPSFDWARRQSLFYAEELERSGRFALTIWPPHTMIGEEGHALAGIVEEARLFHSAVRRALSPVAIKGTATWTESYSIFGAEVRKRWDGRGELDRKNTKLMRDLLANDAIVIAGEAASHCVAWSIDDLLSEIRATDETLAGKIYVLEDCMSSVVTFGPDGAPIPELDFTDRTAANFERWRREGVHVVRSTDDIRSWPGMDRLS